MRRLYFGGALFWLLAAIYFFLMQNGLEAKGGHISFIKSLWLGMTIFMWLYIPFLAVFNKTLGNRLRLAYNLFLLNMLARAVIELVLMYGYGAWQYEYGIAHNLISMALLILLYLWVRKEEFRIWGQNLLVMLGMFFAELYFASYMMLYMRKGEGSETWFVPWSSDHLLNNGITVLVLCGLVFWQVFFFRKGIGRA